MEKSMLSTSGFIDLRQNKRYMQVLYNQNDKIKNEIEFLNENIYGLFVHAKVSLRSALPFLCHYEFLLFFLEALNQVPHNIHALRLDQWYDQSSESVLSLCFHNTVLALLCLTEEMRSPKTHRFLNTNACNCRVRQKKQEQLQSLHSPASTQDTPPGYTWAWGHVARP